MIAQFAPDWWEKLKDEFDKNYITTIHRFLQLQVNKGNEVFPVAQDLYKPFRTDFDDALVVILIPTPIIDYQKSNIMRVMGNYIEDDCYDGLKLNLNLNMDYLTKQSIMILPESLSCGINNTGLSMWKQLTIKAVKLLNDSLNTRLVIYHPDCTSLVKFFDNDRHKCIPLESGCFKEADEFLKKEYNITIEW